MLHMSHYATSIQRRRPHPQLWRAVLGRCFRVPRPRRHPGIGPERRRRYRHIRRQCADREPCLHEAADQLTLSSIYRHDNGAAYPVCRHEQVTLHKQCLLWQSRIVMKTLLECCPVTAADVQHPQPRTALGSAEVDASRLAALKAARSQCRLAAVLKCSASRCNCTLPTACAAGCRESR